VSTRTKAVTKDAQLDDPAAQGKRKRSTLADVTVNKPMARGLAAEKGKAKDVSQAVSVPPSKFAGVVMKNKPATTTALPQSRQVLRSVTAASPCPSLQTDDLFFGCIEPCCHRYKGRTKGNPSC